MRKCIVLLIYKLIISLIIIDIYKLIMNKYIKLTRYIINWYRYRNKISLNIRIKCEIVNIDNN
jgi:hypothetical protein